MARGLSRRADALVWVNIHATLRRVPCADSFPCSSLSPSSRRPPPRSPRPATRPAATPRGSPSCPSSTSRSRGARSRSSRVPFAVGVLDRDDLVRGQPTLGIDEALNNLPGVVVANRYNFSLDQRISIRGVGSRSNFGVRGLKILVDGIPQTLPDGQSQLTNVDFADLERAEVLRGASSSLYGNASGGVISFQTERAAAGPVRPARPGPGRRRQASGRRLLQVAELDVGPERRRERDALGVAVQGRRLPAAQRGRDPPAQRRRRLGGRAATRSPPLRLSLADSPEAQNPGALTRAEYDANPDCAAGNNIRARRRQGRAAAPALPRRARTSTPRGNEYSAIGVRADARSGEPARRAAGRGRRTDQRHLRADRPAGGRRPAQRSAHPRPGRAGAAAHRRRGRPADARRPPEPRLGRRRADRGRCSSTSARRSPSSGRSRSCSGARTSGCW